MAEFPKLLHNYYYSLFGKTTVRWYHFLTENVSN